MWPILSDMGALLVTFGDRGGGRGQAAVVTSPQTQK